MINGFCEFCLTSIFVIFIVGIIIILLIKGWFILCHILSKNGWIKEEFYALSLQDIFRYKLLNTSRYYYKIAKESNASDEWIEMKFKCITSQRFFPVTARIEVDAMLKLEYFYSTYFNLVKFSPKTYLEMYDDFINGKYKKKELYEIKARLQEKLPKCLQEGRELEEMCLLVENGWLDCSGQPVIKKNKKDTSHGRYTYEIVLACYFIVPDNYIQSLHELWGMDQDLIKSHKSRALVSPNYPDLCKEISNIFGREVTKE